MILVDTSVWIDHLKTRGGAADLVSALEAGLVAGHPFVEGELALSGAPTHALLSGVEMLPVSPHVEVLDFVRGLSPPIRGVGWVDAHLLHCALVHGQRLMTRDRRLAALHAALVRR